MWLARARINTRSYWNSLYFIHLPATYTAVCAVILLGAAVVRCRLPRLLVV